MNVKSVIIGCLLASLWVGQVQADDLKGFAYAAETAPVGNEWESPEQLALNKEQPRAWFFSFQDVESARKVLPENSTYWKSLNGEWKFHWAPNPDERPKDFFSSEYDVSSWDAIPVPSSWNIYGIQLSRKEPYVYVPNFLLPSAAGETPELPEPGLFAGKAIINGYILGYDPRLELDMQLSYSDMLFPKPWTSRITVRQDGSFHAEVEMIKPDTVHLSVNRAALTLFLVPGEETTAYIHLPRLSVSAVRLARGKSKNEQKAWFDGAAEIINTELATTGTSRALDAYRLAEKDLMQNQTVAAALDKDIQAVRPLCERMLQDAALTTADRKLLRSLTFDDIGKYIEQKSNALRLEAARSESSREAVIATLDEKVSGSDILPRIIAPHRGRAILIDFWATWCGPCRKSIPAMRPLRKKLASKDIVYIYLTGPSSPEKEWRETLSQMTGVHFRLTEEQWKTLCSSYGITGIPAYLVISHDGKLKSRHVGYPGTDVLEKDLLRAAEE